MNQRIWMGLLSTLLAVSGCTSTPKPASTVRPTKPDDPQDEVPASISKLLPEEITAENYKAKIEQFETELSRERNKERK